ncbi:MAG: CopD family protein [Actinobacteria bacterium]|nr:MAG: CopD family protein [Actinomycetota bacterium]
MDTHARRGRGALWGRGGGAAGGVGSCPARLGVAERRRRAPDRTAASDNPLRRAGPRAQRHHGRRELRQAPGRRREAAHARPRLGDLIAQARRRRLHGSLARALRRWPHRAGGLPVRGRRGAGAAERGADARWYEPDARGDFALVLFRRAARRRRRGALPAARVEACAPGGGRRGGRGRALAARLRRFLPGLPRRIRFDPASRRRDDPLRIDVRDRRNRRHRRRDALGDRARRPTTRARRIRVRSGAPAGPVDRGARARPRAVAAAAERRSGHSPRRRGRSGYGRALLIKTGLLGIAVSLGWLNRSRLVSRLRLSALRRNVAAELVVLAGLVIAVAFLTDLAPGRQFARTVARPQAPRPIAAPPPDATVLAGESGDRAVGLAVSPGGKLQATVLGGDGNGVDGLSVAFRAGGRTFDATGCGPGCYRARGRIQARRVTVVLDSGPVAFEIPVRTEQASAAVAAARRAFAGLRSLVIHERLASSPRDKVVTTWRIVAPDRLTYVTSAGTQAIVIGTKRWDADAKGPFVRSAQVPPLQLPPAEWGPRWLNAKAIGWRRVGGRRARLVSFFDPHLPAWFELAFDPRTHRPLALDMTAAEHFMNQRYTNLNERMRIAPPR